VQGVFASPGAIAFELGPLQIRWYGILMATAILVGFWLAHRRALQEGLPADQLPRPPRQPRPAVSAAVRRRVQALRTWRAAAAERLALDPGVLLPGRLIERLAEAAPADLAALAAVEGLRRWRVQEFGPVLLAALAESPAA